MATDTLSAPQPIFPDLKAATNMPYFDGKTLVFGQSSAPIELTLENKGSIWKRIKRHKALAERMRNLPRVQKIQYRAWKLAYCDLTDKIIRPISTNLPSDATERSPTFYREGNQVHLSFIAGTSTIDGPDYRLYTCSGTDFEHLSPARPLSDEPLIFGFVSPHHICRGKYNKMMITEKATGKSFEIKTDFHLVASVSYLAAEPAKLLITGLNKKKDCQTILYDLSTEKTNTVSSNGPIYKSSLYADQIIYTKQIQEGYENRALYQGTFTLSPSFSHISKGKLS